MVVGVPLREILAAHAASLILIGLIQAALFVALTGMLGTPWFAAGWSSAALPVLAVIVAAAGISAGIAGLVKNAALLQAVGGGGASMLALLGGAFFPLEVAPAGVQRLALVNPFYWAMEALSGGFVYRGLPSQARPLAVLVLMGAAGFVIGVLGLRRSEVPFE